MRYYTIAISDPDTGTVLVPDPISRRFAPVQGATATYTSFVNGRTLSGALNIEIDIASVPFDIPMGAAYVRIWGISLQEIAQSSDLNGKLVSVYAGMQRGLPLATAAVGQNGLIAQGFVFQAFGNWVGTDQTLDLIIYPSIGTGDAPRNIVIDWKKGTPLAQALDQTLATAFPDYTRNIQISPNLVFSEDQVGYYSSLIQFAQWLHPASKSILKGTYQGVRIVLKEKVFTVYDGTTPSTPLPIKFQDMIGQPTWIESPLIQLKCVMRADIEIGDYLELPPALFTTNAAALSQFRNNSAFSGIVQVLRVRHTGNYRQPDAASWATTIDANPVPEA